MTEDAASSQTTGPAAAASTESKDDTIQENESLQNSSHDGSSAPSLHSGQVVPAEEDITNQSTVGARISGPQPATEVFWTIYSAEERMMGNENIEGDEVTPGRSAPSRASTEETSMAPHKVHYYEASWYIALAIFNYLQTLFVCGGVLSGEYFTKDSNLGGLVGNPQYPFTVFLNIVD
jgi:hypothetical protein